METKNSNTAVVVIAFAVIIIVAMICGMVIWLMQRSMAMNERLNDRLLEVRLQEAKALSVQNGAPSQSQTLPTTTDNAALEAMRKQLQEAKAATEREAKARRKVENEMANLLKQTAETTPPTTAIPQALPPAQPKAEVKKQPKKTTTVVKPQPKRQAPTETKASAARVGSDGYPINRITLPMGNDELDWQL
jgi:cell division protein FtsN